MTLVPESITSQEKASSISCDALLVGVTTEDGAVLLHDGDNRFDDAFGGYLGDLAFTGFAGRPGDVLVVPSLGRIRARSLCLVGLGPKRSVTRATICSGAAVAAKRMSESIEIASLLHLALEDRSEAVRAAVEGFAMGAYRFVEHKSDPRPAKLQRVFHIDAPEGAIRLGTISAEAALFARDLINEPASVLTPAVFAERAREAANVYGLECTILDEGRLEELGFGALLSTASGSDAPPRFIHLRYVPESPNGKIALVGKGVTFDSGGLSIKPAASMELMKTDMAGGAVVLAVMTTLGRLGITFEVEAFIPATENMTGGGAMRPGDVIRHYGGRTTEVVNTDAEGRLILADALAYASERGPDAIVDVATLTASMTVALGKKASGLFSNDERLRDELLAAAQITGERTWPFPLYEDYLNELDSDTADHKNSGIRWGGAIIAAMFLQTFVTPGIPWAHLDIAGTGRAERDYLEIGRGGTGVPVRTLIEWLRARS